MNGAISYTVAKDVMRHFPCLLIGLLPAFAQSVMTPSTAPVPIERIAPQYTPAARDAALEGSAILYAEIDEEGRPAAVHVLQGLGMGLDESAEAAVKSWRFQPANINGKPARAGMGIELPFRLTGSWRLSRQAYRFNSSDRKPDAGSFQTPVLVKPVLSAYMRPDSSVCAAETGEVAVSFVVAKDGTVQAPALAHGEARPAAGAALRAVGSWRYQPATRNGKAVEISGEVELSCGSAPPGSAPEFRVGGRVTPPALLAKTEPEYSEEARRAKLQGTVLLSLVVGPDGYAHNIYTLRMLGLGLDEKAIEAVHQWRFKPGMKGEDRVRVMATIEVNFRLL